MRISLFYIFVVLMTASCVEEISIGTDNFESILVVDATITNEEKFQQINLSRTFESGSFEENHEENAQVKVVGDGVEYTFQETVPGTYTSTAPFSALPNVVYQLGIVTSNGSQYGSAQKQLTTATQIDNLYAERIINDDGVDGVAIKVDSFDPTNTSNYYRYSFEETFKVEAPLWRVKDVYVISDYPDCEVGLEERSIDKLICFRTEIIDSFNLIETTGLSENRIIGHKINFLAVDDYKITSRYSLLAHQFVISEEAFTFYNTIKSFSSQGSLFSQVQTGFLMGNIESISNLEEKVIGIFDVVTVTRERLFFNRDDFYTTELPPPFIIECTLTAPLPSPSSPSAGVCGPLVNLVNQNTIVYFDDYKGVPAFIDPGPYLMVPRACGDCTALGQPEPPQFWIE